MSATPAFVHHFSSLEDPLCGVMFFCHPDGELLSPEHISAFTRTMADTRFHYNGVITFTQVEV